MAYTYDSTMLRRVLDSHFTFLAGFHRNVHRYADRLAMYDPDSGRRWTYAQLGADVDRVAGGLAAAGVGPGDVVTFQLFNCPEFALLYLATQQVGAIATPINFRFAPGETAYVFDDSRPSVYVYDSSLSDSARDALSIASHRPPVVIAVGAPELDAPGDAMRFDALLDSTATTSRFDGATTWDETTRLYTSGTTGMPKGVSLPSIVEVLTAHDVIMHFPLTPEDKTLNMSPWFHRGGISPGGPNAVFYAGAAAVPMRRFDAGSCLDLVEAEGLTF